MRYQMISPGSSPVLELTLAQGEKVVAEAGAMCWMTEGIEVKTSTRGGVLSGLSRSVLGGESFFQNEYSATRDGAMVGLVPGQPGLIVAVPMTSDLYLERGAYLASEPTVQVDSKFAGLKGLFNEGLFILRASGTGTLFFGGYGDVEPIEVAGEYVVDNGHALAWDATLDYRIRRIKNVRSFLFGDQLLTEFRGHGRLWVQSRSPYPLASWIYPYRPQRKQN